MIGVDLGRVCGIHGMCMAAIVSRCNGESRVDTGLSFFGKHDRPRTAYQPAAQSCGGVLALLWTAVFLSALCRGRYEFAKHGNVVRAAKARGESRLFLTGFSGEAVGEVRAFLAGFSGVAVVWVGAACLPALWKEHG